MPPSRRSCTTGGEVVSDGPDNGVGPLSQITKALGLLAGVATLVYLSGGFVLALRLGFEDLPWEAVISQLPREFLISIGITTLVVPVLIAASVYTGWRLQRGRDAPLPDVRRPSKEMRRHLQGIAIWISVLLVVPAARSSSTRTVRA